jgi:hypothetical protein
MMVVCALIGIVMGGTLRLNHFVKYEGMENADIFACSNSKLFLPFKYNLVSQPPADFIYLNQTKTCVGNGAVQWLQNQNRARFTATQIDVPLNKRGWQDNIHHPNRIKSTFGRAPTICVRGEVFWGALYSDRGCDYVISRSRSYVPTDAVFLHYTQFDAYYLANHKQARIARDTEDVPRTKACAFMTRYVTFHGPLDSLARWALFLMLRDEVGCEFIGDADLAKRVGIESGGQCDDFGNNAWKCFKQYKVGIAGENTIEEGYVSEKIALPWLGGAVPIYIGAPDVYKHVNTQEAIICQVKSETIKKIRKMKVRKQWKIPKLTERELLVLAIELFEEDLAPCVARVGLLLGMNN